MSDLLIDRLGLEGDGHAGPIRVPFSLPGERVSGEVIDGVIAHPTILTPSPDRVSPVCRHFGTCGGCALQHASDPFLANWKRGVVAQALETRGLPPEIRPLVPTSPPQSRRRAVLGGRRTKKTVITGFYARRSDTLIDVIDCPLIRPEILAAKPILATLTTLGASRGGTIRLAVTAGPAGLDIDVADAKPLDPSLGSALAKVAETTDLARLSWNGETVSLRRPPVQPMGRALVAPPPGAFLQATSQGATALTAAVRAAIGPARRVVDLFAGCGTFSLPLAETAEVLAVEGESTMLAALDAGWRHTSGLRRVTTERRDLFRRPLVALELKLYDAAVIDPPRAGAEAQCRALAASPLPLIAMVSCNPVTFARDAAILIAGGYRLDWVQVVDQFRWSAHVELAAQFTRA